MIYDRHSFTAKSVLAGAMNFYSKLSSPIVHFKKKTFEEMFKHLNYKYPAI